MADNHQYAHNQCYFPAWRNSFKLPGESLDFVPFNCPFSSANAYANSYPYSFYLQRFPWFRIGYFGLWTVTYVIFQWIVHAFVKLGYNSHFVHSTTVKSSYASLSNACFPGKTGGHIHFLICHPRMLHYGIYLSFFSLPL